MRPIRMVKQPLFTGTCGGCVAAMIAGETLDDFCEYYGMYRGPFETPKVFEYLNNRGIIIGYHMNSITPITDDAGRLKGYKVDIPLWQPAYVVAVKRGNKNGTHTIFWDGEKVWDPHNDEPTFNLEDYQVVSWTPVYIPDDKPSEIATAERGKILVVEGATVTIRSDPANVFPGTPCALTSHTEIMDIEPLRPYCLKCLTSQLMEVRDFGFECTACGNKLNNDYKPL